MHNTSQSAKNVLPNQSVIEKLSYVSLCFQNLIQKKGSVISIFESGLALLKHVYRYQLIEKKKLSSTEIIF